MTPSPVRVPVLKRFFYEGRRYQAGELIALPPVVAAIYARQGLVSLTRTLTPELPPAPARRRRTYRRRDLVPEP